MIKVKKKLGGIMRLDEKNSQVNNLVDRYDQKALICFLLNVFAPFFASSFLPPIVTANTNIVSKSEEKNVKKLIEMM